MTNISRPLLILLVLFSAISANAQELSGPYHKPVDGFASNLGRTVLRAADVIAIGTTAASDKKRGTLYFRAFVATQVIWGSTEVRAMRISYKDPELFRHVGHTIAIALVRVARSDVFEAVGTPIDIRDKGALKAVRSYIKVDSTRRSIHERARIMKETLFAQLIAGGSPARFASIELIYLVNLHPQVFSRQDYLLVQGRISEADKNVAHDLKLAMRHLVHRVLKRQAQVALRFSFGNKSEERQWLMILDGYFKDHPAAFGRDDVLRLALIGSGLNETNALSLLRVQSNIEERVAERAEALKALREANPHGLVARGNAGEFREDAWEPQASLFREWQDPTPKAEDE